MTPIIINPGSERDPRALRLYTRANRFIDNEQLPPRSRESMRAARELHRRNHPDARLRSAASTYNCMGLLFSSRRTFIDPDQWALIRRDDGYRRLEDDEAPMPGDIVLYHDHHGALSHVGQVIRVTANIQRADREIEVVSQWGKDGEYIHAAEDVPTVLGTPTQYWTERARS